MSPCTKSLLFLASEFLEDVPRFDARHRVFAQDGTTNSLAFWLRPPFATRLCASHRGGEEQLSDSVNAAPFT